MRAINRSVGDPFKKGIEQGPQVLCTVISAVLKKFSETIPICHLHPIHMLQQIYVKCLSCKIPLMNPIKLSDRLRAVPEGP